MPPSEIGPRANRTVTVNGSVGRYPAAVADVLLGVAPLSSLTIDGAVADRAKEEAKKAASTAPGPASSASQANVLSAVSLAVSRERSRISAVYASPASKGRERGCATLLSSDKGWSASVIVAQLPLLPTDKAQEADKRKRGNAKADAVWDRANANIGRTAPPKSSAQSNAAPAAAAASADPWERAYARIQKEHRA